MSVPKLSFRAKPLKLPIRDLEKQAAAPKIEESPPAKKIPYKYAWILLLPLLLLIRRPEIHRIKAIPCVTKGKSIQCKSNMKGTFVVEPSEKCTSIYEIDGVPFSVAGKRIFRVPANTLKIKDAVGACTVRAFIDTKRTTIHQPFTFITTSQHTSFTITSNGNKIVDRAAASLFESKVRGKWIAYTYDAPKGSSVTGDGSDIIYTYDVRTIG